MTALTRVWLGFLLSRVRSRCPKIVRNTWLGEGLARECSRPKPLSTFYLLRHGDAEGNKERIILGQIDVPLTELGRKQADLLGRALSSVTFDAVFASDLERTRHTAEAVLRHQKGGEQCQRLVLDRRLREIDAGTLQGKPSSELQAYNDSLSGDVYTTVRPGGESMALFDQRVARAFDDIYEWYPHGTVAIATHVNVIRSTIRRALGLDPRETVAPIENCSISVLERDISGWRLIKSNDTSHLERL
jgi:probable phosphoglycerate mutase